jgi:mono/diheme cytochrome c family protein
MRKFIGIGVVALSLAFAGSAMAANGAGLFKSKCLACHGPDGKGTAMAPAFAGNAWIKDTSAADIAAVIKKGRNGSAKLYKNFALGMPPQGSLSDGDINALVEYLKSLSN